MSDSEKVFEDLDLAFAALEDGRLDEAASQLDGLAERAPDVPEVFFVRGQLEALREDLPAALAAYAKAVEIDPAYADAHYARAQVARATGDDDAARAHDLEVLRLDAEADAQLSEEETQEILQALEGEAERVLGDLPEPFRSALADVPILMEARPSEELVRTGFDPRALGLFEGPDHASRTGVEPPPAPAHIVLYWTNILDVSEDDQHLAEELEITLLHEIAHYFGLDEEQVADLGLA